MQSIRSSDSMDYELLDSGNSRKLERFGTVILDRPEPMALWRPVHPDRWRAAAARYVHGNGDQGHWEHTGTVAESWDVTVSPTIRCHLRLTPFRHVGIFPEQRSQWSYLESHLPKAGRPKVLNLFGYTGVASLMAAARGAMVTHVDASKKVISWARENQTLSGISDQSIRWIVDDAVKFIKREVNRGNRYQVVLVDPPKFGRGPKGEIFRLEDELYGLIELCRSLVEPIGGSLILTCYALRLTPTVLKNVFADVFSELHGSMECGELDLTQSLSGRKLPLAMYARWTQGGAP